MTYFNWPVPESILRYIHMVDADKHYVFRIIFAWKRNISAKEALLQNAWLRVVPTAALTMPLGSMDCSPEGIHQLSCQLLSAWPDHAEKNLVAWFRFHEL